MKIIILILMITQKKQSGEIKRRGGGTLVITTFKQTALCKLVRALHTTRILSVLATSVSHLCLSRFTGIGPFKSVFVF